MSKEVLETLKETRKDYKSMIEFCCDDLVLNNDIMPALISNGFVIESFEKGKNRKQAPQKKQNISFRTKKRVDEWITN